MSRKERKTKKKASEPITWVSVAPAVELWVQLGNLRSAFNRDIEVTLIVRQTGVFLKGAECSEGDDRPAPPITSAEAITNQQPKIVDKGEFSYVG